MTLDLLFAGALVFLVVAAIVLHMARVADRDVWYEGDEPEPRKRDPEEGAPSD